MKVLFVSHAADLHGGAENSFLTIILGLDRRIFTPIVILPRLGQISAKLTQENIKFYLVPQAWMLFERPYRLIIAVNFLINLIPVCRLRKIILKERIDCVYTNTIVIFAGAIAAKLTGVPHIWHIRELVFNDYYMWRFKPSLLKSILNILSDRLVVISKAVFENLNLQSLQEKVSIISNGLEDKVWDTPSESEIIQLRKEFNIPSAAHVIIFVGAIIAKKEPDKAVEMLTHLKRNDVYLLLVGYTDAKMMKKIQDLIIQNNLDGRVIFTGFRSDALRLLALAKIAVFPTCYEAFGRVTVEAMAAGLAVISGKGGGSLEIIKDGETGFLIDQGNPSQMAELVTRLLNDDKLRRKIGVAACNASRKYSRSHYLAEVSKLIIEMKSFHKLPEGILDHLAR